MERGVIVGGSLIAASFLVAVMLNRSAHQEIVPVEAVRPPPARACADAKQQRAIVATNASPGEEEQCKQPPAKSSPR
jgi:hypothetical protein